MEYKPPCHTLKHRSTPRFLLAPLQGVREEIGLIKWPAPVKAVIQTLLVTAIVAGTSAGLLAINGLLSELSKVY